MTAPRTNVVALRSSATPTPKPVRPIRHPSVYDRTTEPRRRLALDEVTTIPLSLTGVEWQYLVSLLTKYVWPAAQELGADIDRQIHDVLEDRP